MSVHANSFGDCPLDIVFSSLRGKRPAESTQINPTELEISESADWLGQDLKPLVMSNCLEVMAFAVKISYATAMECGRKSGVEKLTPSGLNRVSKGTFKSQSCPFLRQICLLKVLCPRGEELLVKSPFLQAKWPLF